MGISRHKKQQSAIPIKHSTTKRLFSSDEAHPEWQTITTDDVLKATKKTLAKIR